jgi:hypothetical protein
MKNKIVLYGLEDRCKSLKSQNKSYTQIAQALTKESDKKISVMAVSRYFKSNREALAEAVNKSEVLKEQRACEYLDAISQLRAINEETFSILAEAKTAKDHKISLKAIERIEKQLELQAKLLSEINENKAPEYVPIREVVIHEQWRED